MSDGLQDAIIAISSALLLATGSSLFVECLLRPRSRCLCRRPTGYGVHSGLIAITFTLLLAITQRPFFAAALTASMTLVIVIVSNAKFRALREPFVFTDFGLFSQALRHPRLYLPFLGLVPALVGLVTVVVAAAAGITLEPALSTTTGAVGLTAIALALLLTAGFLLTIATQQAKPVTFDPVRDIADYGLLPSLWLYWLAERRQLCGSPPAASAEDGIPATATTGELPHIVVVQSESFFDVRRLWPKVHPSILENFDHISRQAMLHGRLAVPAWGANTMRTEFGFLSGIAATDLGAHRFNPYRRLARQPTESIASRLRRLGYHTICLHPHPASFFDRDQVMPQLGFNEFLDITAFADATRDGPYIADVEVTKKVRQLLNRASVPTFVFAITMENHGPLHLEQVAAGELERLFEQPPPEGFDDLAVYLRHLKNADRMIGNLCTALARDHRNSLLCFFGDHVPSMPGVYDATGFTDGHSDYFIWSPDAGPGTLLDTDSEALGGLLLNTLSRPGPFTTGSPAAGVPAKDPTGP
jgi:hypothetical protein